MKCYQCLEAISKESNSVHGLHQNCFLSVFGVSEGEDFKSLAIKSQASESRTNNEEIDSRINSSFFHGKFKKYSASLGLFSYILKVKDNAYPELPQMEYLCNQIAQILGIHVAEFALIEFQNNITTFVTKNFMPKTPASNLVHLYHYTKAYEDWNLQFLLNVVKKETKKFKDAERFLNLCLFDALIGNHDRHGRNLAFIQQAKSCFLSPFYDNPSYLGIEDELLLGAHHEPKGTIATSQTTEPTMKDYVKEMQLLGYGDILKSFKNKIENRQKRMNSAIDNAFISDKRKKAFSNLIARRIEELNQYDG